MMFGLLFYLLIILSSFAFCEFRDNSPRALAPWALTARAHPVQQQRDLEGLWVCLSHHPKLQGNMWWWYQLNYVRTSAFYMQCLSIRNEFQSYKDNAMLGSYHTRHIKRTNNTLIPNDTIEWTLAAKTAMEKVFIGLARLINRKYEFRLLWEIVLIYLNNL